MSTAVAHSNLPRPEIHGHRGCRGLWPENTLPAFVHAVALGVDVLELDVVISADNQVVVSHEPWFSAAICRLPNGALIDPAQELRHNLYQLTYAEIRQYDCGLTQHPRFPEQQPTPAYKPLLRDVIRRVEAQAKELGRRALRYSVEIKTEPDGDNLFHPAPPEFVALVVAALGEEGVLERTTLLSFDKRILQQARLLIPKGPLCLLVEDGQSLAHHLAELGFVPAVFGPDYTLLTPSLLHEVQALGLRLVPWTVNDVAAMQQLVTLGVQGITTDYPNRLRDVLNGQQ
ncbi:glycerophosphodiester phosphodiesterase family protein [Hymenobacter chitinivorans]|uniref:Glycerophosphoryl diester phosphodiesterase n=1 Tax=Hymenobacter chitinivorans DSM 11115 TaxID=1121954 RepID=A0A2M9ARM3_9BACT|nr:glycerophosphodiester phosphodiesterase family protein [Hymenobacter chitinivorans]PJJ48351.1 glycerophosphoryl diester phosphodiesterase [Hymenobacter chitinivorans DSM 11115]